MRNHCCRSFSSRFFGKPAVSRPDVTATRPTIAKSFTPAAIASGGTSTLLVTINNPNAAPITVTSVTDTIQSIAATLSNRVGTSNSVSLALR